MASQTAAPTVSADVAAAAAAAAKPKRVRTGCLTCRERHLKCDEGLPDCQNCKKSNRECKRGVRLNFIDTTIKPPPITPPTEEWDVAFQDESREIASEYRGGLRRYSTLEAEPDIAPKEEPPFDFSETMISAPLLSHQQLPAQQFPQQFAQGGLDPSSAPMQMTDQITDQHQRHASVNSDSTFSSQTIGANSMSSYTTSKQTLTPPNETRDTLTDPDESLYMQVFVEEVAIWMDSMDPHKHFSRLLPFQALNEPMMLNAFFACGARHLSLVNPSYQTEEKAVAFYEASTKMLLRNLQNPYRNTVVCATTAVILNIYETMCEKALQRMNHIAGARALIKECGWNANSQGVSGACFWLNIGLELLSCLHFNWQTAWNPDDWGLDMDFSHPTGPGQEEVWTHRIMWILGKVANFRAKAAIEQQGDHIRIQQKCDEWQSLKDWCDLWDKCVPQTMRPLCRAISYTSTKRSLFPEVWLIKRAAVVARLFYHTTLILLSQNHPTLSLEQQRSQDIQEMQMFHVRELCGIIAHQKDRGVASVAIRSIHHAGECITARGEQEEVIAILNKIHKETGWRVKFIHDDLVQKWGWNNRNNFEQISMLPQATNMVQNYPAQYPQQNQALATSLPPVPPTKPVMKNSMAGMVNPMLAKADFSLPAHPYQSYWVPTSQPAAPSQPIQFNSF